LTLNDLLLNHHRNTGSPIAKTILDDFKTNLKRFVKVMPIEYKRILTRRAMAEEAELSEVSDG
jgi:glutamate synthase (NADPH/NADH) large chain